MRVWLVVLGWGMCTPRTEGKKGGSVEVVDKGGPVLWKWWMVGGR